MEASLSPLYVGLKAKIATLDIVSDEQFTFLRNHTLRIAATRSKSKCSTYPSCNNTYLLFLPLSICPIEIAFASEYHLYLWTVQCNELRLFSSAASAKCATPNGKMFVNRAPLLQDDPVLLS